MRTYEYLINRLFTSDNGKRKGQLNNTRMGSKKYKSILSKLEEKFDKLFPELKEIRVADKLKYLSYRGDIPECPICGNKLFPISMKNRAVFFAASCSEECGYSITHEKTKKKFRSKRPSEYIKDSKHYTLDKISAAQELFLKKVDENLTLDETKRNIKHIISFLEDERDFDEIFALLEYRKKNPKVNTSKEYFLLLYGEEKGIKKYENFISNTSKNSAHIGANSIEYCIEKYGEEKGKKIYKQRCKNISKKAQGRFKGDSYFERMKNAHPELSSEEIEERVRSWQVKQMSINSCLFSKISQKLFWSIYESNPEQFYKCHFAEKDFEISLHGKNTRFLYDFCFEDKIIEFNGDYWHRNPAIYKETDETVQVWKKDERKNNFASQKGYNIYIVWEQNYKNDPQGTIQECLKFLEEK